MGRRAAGIVRPAPADDGCSSRCSTVWARALSATSSTSMAGSLAIETKDEDKWLTPYQRITAPHDLRDRRYRLHHQYHRMGVAALGRWLKRN